jgi:Bacterial regulatory proteins, tetR family
VGWPALTAANVFPIAFACPWTYRSEAAHSPRSGRIRDRVQDDQREGAGGVGLVFEDVGPVGHRRRVQAVPFRALPRAGVGKAALYRSWPSKREMLHRPRGSIRNKGCPTGGHRKPARRPCRYCRRGIRGAGQPLDPPRDPIACRPGAAFARARHRPRRAFRQPAADQRRSSSTRPPTS